MLLDEDDLRNRPEALDQARIERLINDNLHQVASRTHESLTKRSFCGSNDKGAHNTPGSIRTYADLGHPSSYKTCSRTLAGTEHQNCSRTLADTEHLGLAEWVPWGPGGCGQKLEILQQNELTTALDSFVHKV
eukprot:321615-Prorocentrum_minimum.AAC.5